MKKILLVTGGTGGHVVPSIAFLEHLKNNFSVKIVTDARGSKYINKNDYNYQLIDVPNLFSKFYLFPLNIPAFQFRSYLITNSPILEVMQRNHQMVFHYHPYQLRCVVQLNYQ